MLTVACVNWRNYRGRGGEYVTRLRNMVARHLSVPHRFVCFTDGSAPDGIESAALPKDLPGWWAKLWLLSAGLFDDDVLYFDLDVVLRANVDRIHHVARSDRTRLWMRDDFSYSRRTPKTGLSADQIEFLGGPGCCNSSVMAWHADAARDAWDQFTPDVMKRQHGDQNHVTRVLYPDKIGFLPDDLIGSYKYGKLRGEPYAPVMVFHGEPKMDSLPASHELRRVWEAA